MNTKKCSSILKPSRMGTIRKLASKRKIAVLVIIMIANILWGATEFKALTPIINPAPDPFYSYNYQYFYHCGHFEWGEYKTLIHSVQLWHKDYINEGVAADIYVIIEPYQEAYRLKVIHYIMKTSKARQHKQAIMSYIEYLHGLVIDGDFYETGR